MIDSLITSVHAWALVLPPESIAFFGSITEEIIAPIPSPLLMTLLGSIAASLKEPWPYLLLLAFIGSIGKTLGSYVFYKAAEILEHKAFERFGTLLGVTEADVESLRAKLGGGWRDDFTIFIFRAAPILPTTPISVAAGLLKIDRATYIRNTVAGFFVRNLFYLALGYEGLESVQAITRTMEDQQHIGSVLTLFAIALTFGYIYYKRRFEK